MKFKDIENKSIVELNELLNDLRAESFTLGWKNKTQQQDQTHKIRLVRRDIARVLTAIRKIELASENVEKTKSKNTSSKTKIQKKATTKTKSTVKKETKNDKEINNGTTNKTE